MQAEQQLGAKEFAEDEACFIRTVRSQRCHNLCSLSSLASGKNEPHIVFFFRRT